MQGWESRRTRCVLGSSVAYDRDQLNIVCNTRLLKYIAAGVKWTLFLGRSRITGIVMVSMHAWTSSSFESESL